MLEDIQADCAMRDRQNHACNPGSTPMQPCSLLCLAGAEHSAFILSISLKELRALCVHDSFTQAILF